MGSYEKKKLKRWEAGVGGSSRKLTDHEVKHVAVRTCFRLEVV